MRLKPSIKLEMLKSGENTKIYTPISKHPESRFKEENKSLI